MESVYTRKDIVINQAESIETGEQQPAIRMTVSILFLNFRSSIKRTDNGTIDGQITNAVTKKI